MASVDGNYDALMKYAKDIAPQPRSSESPQDRADKRGRGSFYVQRVLAVTGTTTYEVGCADAFSVTFLGGFSTQCLIDFVRPDGQSDTALADATIPSTLLGPGARWRTKRGTFSRFFLSVPSPVGAGATSWNYFLICRDRFAEFDVPNFIATVNGGSVFNEIPTGAVDGVNTVYNTVSIFTSISVYIKQGAGPPVKTENYVAAGGSNVITFNDAPPVGSVIYADYQKK